MITPLQVYSYLLKLTILYDLWFPTIDDHRCKWVHGKSNRKNTRTYRSSQWKGCPFRWVIYGPSTGCMLSHMPKLGYGGKLQEKIASDLQGLIEVRRWFLRVLHFPPLDSHYASVLLKKIADKRNTENNSISAWPTMSSCKEWTICKRSASPLDICTVFSPFCKNLDNDWL